MPFLFYFTQELCLKLNYSKLSENHQIFNKAKIKAICLLCLNRRRISLHFFPRNCQFQKDIDIKTFYNELYHRKDQESRYCVISNYRTKILKCGNIKMC